MGENSHLSNSPHTQKQNATSVDAADAQRLTDNAKANENISVEKAPPHGAQSQATIEEFGREGMGVAAKE